MRSSTNQVSEVKVFEIKRDQRNQSTWKLDLLYHVVTAARFIDLVAVKETLRLELSQNERAASAGLSITEVNFKIRPKMGQQNKGEI